MKPYDKAFFINLDRSRDRLRHMRAELALHGIEAELFPAIDSCALNPANYIETPYFDEEFFGQSERAGSIACFLSHVKLWEHVHSDPRCDVALILEDDIVFERGFLQRLEVFFRRIPDDWDMIWVGHGGKLLGREVSTGVICPSLSDVKRHNSHHHAYLVRSESIPRLLNVLLPIDEIKDVKLRRNFSGFKAYFLKESLAHQDPRFPSCRRPGFLPQSPIGI